MLPRSICAREALVSSLETRASKMAASRKLVARATAATAFGKDAWNQISSLAACYRTRCPLFIHSLCLTSSLSFSRSLSVSNSRSLTLSLCLALAASSLTYPSLSAKYERNIC